MKPVQLLVKYHTPEVRERARLQRRVAGDAGFDLANASDGAITIPPQSFREIPAGLSVKVEDGWCLFVKPRSSTFVRRQLIVQAGVIDSGYTGPVYTCVWNPSPDQPAVVEPWERLGQLIVLPAPEVEVLEVEQMPLTVRGQKGFGSTGA